MGKPANTQKTGKRKAPKTAWKPGKSGNPAGRPKDGESWAAIIKTVGDMDRDDLLGIVAPSNELGRQVAQLPPKVQMKYLVTIRVYVALMFEPTAGLWNGLMDRGEGKVPERLQLEGTLNVENLDDRLDKVYGTDNHPGG